MTGRDAVPGTVFILHADDPDDRTYVRSYLVPALGLPSEWVKTSSTFELGLLRTEALAESLHSTSMTIVVLSPALSAQNWSSFCGSVAAWRAVQGGRVVQLQRMDCELSLLQEAVVTLDMRDPQERENGLDRLRQIIDQPAPSRSTLPCPYPGLQAYTEAQAQLFAGRERDVQELVSRFADGVREAYILGASGSGKSSLLRAGVAARLARAGDSVVGEPFVICEIRPGVEISECLRPACEQLAATAARVLVIVDPLEEILLCADEEAGRAFFGSLEELRQEERCHLAFVLRADLLGQLLESELGPHAKKAYQHQLTRLEGEELRLAIAAPARSVQAALAPALIERLIGDAGHSSGALPLLQATLVALWDRRDYDYLSLESYLALGSGAVHGLAAVLTARADAALSGLDEQALHIARRIFLRLVRMDSALLVRRQRRRSDLRGGEASTDLERVLATLQNHRLITRDGESGAGDGTVDLAHEILISAWPQLRGWIDQHRMHEVRRSALDERARQWTRRVESGAAGGGLLDEAELHELDGWFTPAAREAVGCDEPLAHFIDESRRAAAKREAEREAHAAELRDEQEQQRRLLARYHVAQAQSLLRGRRGAKALPYLVAARALGAEGPSLELLGHWARRALPKATRPGRAHLIAWSPEGGRLALAEGTAVKIWDLQSKRELPLAGSGEKVTHVAWHPHGQLLAVASGATTLLWHAGQATLASKPLEHPGPISAMTWAPDGKALEVGCGARQRWGWDPRAQQMELILVEGTENNSEAGEPSHRTRPGRVTRAVAPSPCGTLVAVAEEGCTTQIKKVSSERPASPLFEHASEVIALRWNPVASTLASLTCEGDIQLWDTQDPSAVSRSVHLAGRDATAMARRGDGVLEVRSPDGHFLASARGQAVRLRVASSDEEAGSLLDHSGDVKALAWSPEGVWLAALCRGGRARIWDTRAGYTVAPDFECDGEARALEWSDDGTSLTAVMEDGESAYRWPVQRDRDSLEQWREAVEAGLYHLAAGELIRRAAK